MSAASAPLMTIPSPGGLRLLAIQKLGLADKIPDSVASHFRRRIKDPGLDFADPVTYQKLAQGLAARDEELGEPQDVTGRPLPYRLLHGLQSQAPGGVSQDMPGRIRSICNKISVAIKPFLA